RLDEPAIDAPLLSGGGDGGDFASDRGGVRLERRRSAHDCTAPPSSTSPWPLMPSAAPEHRNVVSAATSAAVISRPWGLKCSRTARASWGERPVLAEMFAVEASVIAVSTYPGQTAFTVIPWDATSAATARVRPSRACLDAA